MPLDTASLEPWTARPLRTGGEETAGELFDEPTGVVRLFDAVSGVADDVEEVVVVVDAEVFDFPKFRVALRLCSLFRLHDERRRREPASCLRLASVFAVCAHMRLCRECLAACRECRSACACCRAASPLPLDVAAIAAMHNRVIKVKAIRRMGGFLASGIAGPSGSRHDVLMPDATSRPDVQCPGWTLLDGELGVLPGLC